MMNRLFFGYHWDFNGMSYLDEACAGATGNERRTISFAFVIGVFGGQLILTTFILATTRIESCRHGYQQ
jgi:hypothetical protein